MSSVGNQSDYIGDFGGEVIELKMVEQAGSSRSFKKTRKTRKEFPHENCLDVHELYHQEMKKDARRVAERIIEELGVIKNCQR